MPLFCRKFRFQPDRKKEKRLFPWKKLSGLALQASTLPHSSVTNTAGGMKRTGIYLHSWLRNRYVKITDVPKTAAGKITEGAIVIWRVKNHKLDFFFFSKEKEGTYQNAIIFATASSLYVPGLLLKGTVSFSRKCYKTVLKELDLPSHIFLYIFCLNSLKSKLITSGLSTFQFSFNYVCYHI